MKRNMNVKKAISGMLELPKEVTLNLPLISLIGNEELFLENYKGIIEYTEEKIRLNTSCGILKIEGKSLFLKQITEENVLVTGKLSSIEYLL